MVTMVLPSVAHLRWGVVSLHDLPLALSVPQVAELLNIGRNTVYELVRSHQLRSVRIGRQIRIPRSALEDYLNGPTNEIA